MKYLFILLLGLGFSQTELTTRVYELNLSNIYENMTYNIDMYELTGHNLDMAYLKIMKVEDYQINNEYGFIHLESSYNDCNSNQWQGYYLRLNNQSCGGTPEYTYQQVKDIIYDGSNQIRINTGWIFSGYVNMLIAVTAEFPEEDTGYIEEGFEFCVSPGANLLSFPCDNPISVEESLPDGVENFIYSIIGEGVATTYTPSGWVGSLEDFDPGSGYWFKSNESLCFEYDCVED